jgi:hypothetical protein
MRRETQKTKHEIYTCTPWFLWEECLFCGLEFRREKGWRFQARMKSSWDYACNSCCPTKEECDNRVELFKKRKPLRPSAIPNLPPVTCDVPMPKVKPFRKSDQDKVVLRFMDKGLNCIIAIPEIPKENV